MKDAELRSERGKAVIGEGRNHKYSLVVTAPDGKVKYENHSLPNFLVAIEKAKMILGIASPRRRVRF